MEPINTEKIVENHEQRIQELERYRTEQEKSNLEIKLKLTETEKTVMKESNKQQALVQKLIDHILNNDTFSRKEKTETRKFNQEMLWKTLAILLGSGGILCLIIQALLHK